jgi:hypothetical protein
MMFCFLLRVAFIFIFAQIPLKANGVQSGDALLGHTGRLSIAKELVLTALSLDPHSQLSVLGISAGYIAVAISSLIIKKVLKPLVPDGTVGVPDKANLFKSSNSLIGHCGSLCFCLELVLITLSLDPLGQGRLLWEGIRYEAVAKVVAELDKLFELLSPVLSLVGSELEAGAIFGAVIVYVIIDDAAGSTVLIRRLLTEERVGDSSVLLRHCCLAWNGSLECRVVERRRLLQGLERLALRLKRLNDTGYACVSLLLQHVEHWLGKVVNGDNATGGVFSVIVSGRRHVRRRSHMSSSRLLCHHCWLLVGDALNHILLDFTVSPPALAKRNRRPTHCDPALLRCGSLLLRQHGLRCGSLLLRQHGLEVVVVHSLSRGGRRIIGSLAVLKNVEARGLKHVHHASVVFHCKEEGKSCWLE